MATTCTCTFVLCLSLTFFMLSSASSTEADVLLSFKGSIQDPKNTLSSWSNNSAVHYCNWTGITCTTSPPLAVTSLNLQNLNLSGEISYSICELTSLALLNLADNYFNQPIPLHLSQCSSLESLNLSNNHIWGPIPDQISQFHSLRVFDFSKNHIEGRIPESFGLLVKLQVLNLGSNLLSGSVPSVFVNLTELAVLDLSQNVYLMSDVPSEIGKLGKLEQLLLQSSGFYGQIPESFVGLQSLTILDLARNNLSGVIPQTLGSSLKNLVSFDVSQNKLSGSFPNDICSAPGLKNLGLHTNFLYGSIPNSIGECSNLERFQVQNNEFSGDFPAGLLSLSKIKLIRAENNRFSGAIPDSMSMATQLEQVQIDNNSFTGKIPHGLGLVKSLYRFSASLNGLYGELPPNFCDSPVMREVPPDLVSGLPASFLEGNPGLCGPGLPNSCSVDLPRHHNAAGLSALACALLSIAFGLGILLVAAGFFVFHRSTKWKSETGGWHSVFFYPLRVTEHDLVTGMDDKSAVGSGGAFGRVYIISLPSGELVAVKKLVNIGNQSSKTLKAEIKTLAKIRHKNIIKVLGFCHSEESIFLIYEYLPKGSLRDLFSRADFQLQWSDRLKISIGVAQGLAYLHKHYVPHLLHRNIKSTNILLDADFEPKLTDFALDRIVGEAAFQTTIASESAYSCYNAPECGYTKKATEQMDVYSFGVVLLELIAGRQADPAESVDIVKWVRRKINIANGAVQVLDSKISNSFQQEMLAALDVAIHCTSVLPEKRPSMVKVIRALQSLGSKPRLSDSYLSTHEENSVPV
ncbi:hypothetical protein DKX38_009142 [Salix brachista]|uniref:Protein kinase domain-containing protein n=1 Tax=Salix brachista TaxID=2182728 RepID=A0A5N5MC55_9ROSI|nr:hypothetical protein DKX38_009142 [Salix brachista]